MQNLLEDYSEKLKALGHPTRLEILIMLSKQPSNVGYICDKLDSSQSATSQHLSVLKNKQIIKGKRDGTKIEYHIVDNFVKEMVKTLEKSIKE